MEKKEDVTMVIEPSTSSVSRTHYKWIAASILIGCVILVGGAIVAVVIHHRLEQKEDFATTSVVSGRKVPEHVRVDFHNEVIYVSNKRHGEIDGLNALHVYARGMLAFRDLTNNKCYIDRLNETFQDGLNFWQSQEGRERIPKRQYFRYIERPIDSDVLRTFGGDLIADHCSDVPSHWIVALPEGAVDSENEAFLNKTAEFICRPRGTVVRFPDEFPFTPSPFNPEQLRRQ